LFKALLSVFISSGWRCHPWACGSSAGGFPAATCFSMVVRGSGSRPGGTSPGVQGVGPGGPSVAGAFGVVEGGVGAQRVEFVPGQVVADGEPQGGISRFPGLG
jgi:hypothetical protein